jgi:predicted dehydrogenase
MLRIGLIGAGWHATADHAPALRHCADDEEFRGRVELSGVCDIDRAKATEVAQRFGFRRAYDSIDAMLSEVDAVLSIIPPAAMTATLPAIIQHSRPVLIEKPLGRDLDEARRIAAMLDGHPHMVSLNRRFHPAVQAARQWMARQSPPRLAVANMAREDRREPDFTWSTGIHTTDLLCFLFGPLRLATSWRCGTSRYGRFERADGFHGSIAVEPQDDRIDETVYACGEDWFVSITAAPNEPWWVVCRGGRGDGVNSSGDPATPDFVRNGTVDETAAFLRGVLRGEMPGPTAADAMRGTELAAALQALVDDPRYAIRLL